MAISTWLSHHTYLLCTTERGEWKTVSHKIQSIDMSFIGNCEWPRLQSLFKVSTEFSATPVACQILAAMSIIAKLSFWIKKPAKQTNLNEVQSLPVQPFEELIRDAFSEFRREGYVKKLKTSITSESLPSDKEDLIEFLSNKIAFP
ncbi:hypothetical protein AX14_012100 [Amanita brunnescens Koide BX004]|nr:hypothetical protein AX14_012100 [Amanita brunnescens Koide BX004]